jgi:hypothetical protein
MINTFLGVVYVALVIFSLYFFPWERFEPKHDQIGWDKKQLMAALQEWNLLVFVSNSLFVKASATESSAPRRLEGGVGG